MGPQTITRLASAATIAAVTSLALAVPATASETGPGGGSSDASTGQGADTRRTQSIHDAAVVVVDGTQRTTSVHDATKGVWPETPPPSDTGATAWEALPVATGALGGLALAGMGFAAVVLVRRHHEHGGMAHPA